MKDLQFPIFVYNYVESFEISLQYNNNFIFNATNLLDKQFGQQIILSYIKNNKLENKWKEFFLKNNNIELTFDVLKNNSSIFYLKNIEYNNILELKYINNALFKLNNQNELQYCLNKFKNYSLKFVDNINNEVIIDNTQQFNYKNLNLYLQQFLKYNSRKNLIKLINNSEVINYNYDKIFYEKRFKYIKNIFINKTDKFVYLILPVRKIKLMKNNKFIKTTYDCIEFSFTEEQLKQYKIFSYYRKCYDKENFNNFLKYK